MKSKWLKTAFTAMICLAMAAVFGGCSAKSGSIETEYDFTYTNSEMVQVPAGSFVMGYDDTAGEKHAVTLSEYYIAKYEVCYRLWFYVRTWANNHGYTFDNSGREGKNGVVGNYPASGDLLPVTCVNWRDSVAWCNAFSEALGLTPVYSNYNNTSVYRNSYTDGDIGSNNINMNVNGFRLPTEAEWEYASRYVDGTAFTPGDQYSGYVTGSNAVDFGWYDVNSLGTIWAVALKTTNALGIYDMSGNVGEWCWDAFCGNYTADAAVNPLGMTFASNRVIRGGGSGSTMQCLRTSKRHNEAPDYKGFFVGFRLARSTTN